MIKSIDKYLRNGLKILMIFSIISVVVLTSEFIYMLKNEPQTLKTYASKPKEFEKSYLENYNFDGTRNSRLAKLNDRITLEILHNFLSDSQKKASEDSCKPLCLSYKDSQYFLDLFKKFDVEDKVANLSLEKQSDLYFWMATINLWHDGNDVTYEFIRKAVEASNKNPEANYLSVDLQKLRDLENNPELEDYFAQKIENPSNIRQYEKTLLAKAAYKIAGNYVSKKDYNKALSYFVKSEELNPWNLTYNMSLSGTYLFLEKPEEAKHVLNKCIENLKESSTECRDRLTSINPK